MINRLKSLKDMRDLNQPAVKEFPKAKITLRVKNNGKSNGGNKNKKENNVDILTGVTSDKASQGSARKGITEATN